MLVAGVLVWTFQLYLQFYSKILANLTTNWKTCSPTKPANKMIDKICHHDNWVI